jgi:anti-sigma B factor antagonist
MPEERFSAETAVHGSDVVVVVAGDLDLATVPRLEQALTSALAVACDVTRVVVDLRAVEFIDSSGLTALIKAHRRAGDDGRPLVLRAPSARVMRTLELTQLDSVLDVE